MAEVLTRLLTGDLSKKAGGFLLRMPDGFTGREFISTAAHGAYGGESHPDLRILDTEKTTIPVDSIREARAFLATSPMGDQFKTLIVIAADRMNDAAANAFLKVLEEPGRKTRIILCSDRPWTLPATILSRCEKYLETPPENSALLEVQSLLEEEVDDARLKSALTRSGNHPAAARDIILFNLDDWHEKALTWIGTPKGAQPVIKPPAKTTPPLSSLFRLLQKSLADTIQGTPGGQPVPGWNQERAEKAFLVLQKMSRGAERPGIDWKTRLHATLSCLAHCQE